MIRKEIKQDGTFGGNYPEDINYTRLPDKFILISEDQRDYIDSNIGKLIYDEMQEGIWIEPKGVVDVSDSNEFKNKMAQVEKEVKIEELQSQIGAIDVKRIRAIAEPQLKDAQSGETWLEYYTQQIQSIRAEIAAL